jgi:hypothetical protein
MAGLSISVSFSLISASVIYRTKDNKLPEFKDGAEPGEIYFDVRILGLPRVLPVLTDLSPTF